VVSLRSSSSSSASDELAVVAKERACVDVSRVGAASHEMISSGKLVGIDGASDRTEGFSVFSVTMQVNMTPHVGSVVSLDCCLDMSAINFEKERKFANEGNDF